MKKKLLLLCVVLMCSLSSYGQSGQIGNISWNITDSVLTISGTGDMPNFNINQQPWYSYRYNIMRVVIENSVTNIGNYAFYNYLNISSIELPHSVTNIGDGAFYGCSGIIDIEMPNSIINIGRGAFHSCSKLANITIPNSVTNIEDIAFVGCTSLTSVEIPDSVIHIGAGAFGSCSNLKRIKLPNNITNIEINTFYYCTSLIKIEIPSSVTSIGDGTFTNTTNLKYVDVYWNEPISINSPVFQNSNLSNAILIVPTGTKALYEAAPVWQDFGTIIERPIPESVSIYASLLVGSSLLLEAEIIPSNTIYQDVTWSSSDVAVATVDATGQVTGVSPGIATITATTDIGGKTASFKVKVKEGVIGIRSDATANSLIDESNVNVSLIDRTLTVNTPDKETIKVYSMIGTLIYSAQKQEGKQTYFVPNLSKEIYIVTGSSGWNAKLLNK
ncbi:MAG TPA: hypothetical protein DEQ30_01850 [Porphyromonadaceae bacterium]|nr:hypothetical protein [Porphyromonadaceae bacterium]